MTAQSSTSVPTNAATVLPPLTPAASDTFTSSQFGPTGILLTITTTGTGTTVTVTDPGATPMGSPGTPANVTCGATAITATMLTPSMINRVADTCTVNFSGARTGITYTAARV